MKYARVQVSCSQCSKECTVYAAIVHGRYYWNGCDDMNGSNECRRCKVTVESLLENRTSDEPISKLFLD